MDEFKYRLIAQVLRRWRADPEERVLGEFILELLEIDRPFIERHNVDEIRDELIRRSTKQVQQEEVKAEASTEDANEWNAAKEDVVQVLTPVKINKFANLPPRQPRGRKLNASSA